MMQLTIPSCKYIKLDSHNDIFYTILLLPLNIIRFGLFAPPKIFAYNSSGL